MSDIPQQNAPQDPSKTLKVLRSISTVASVLGVPASMAVDVMVDDPDDRRLYQGLLAAVATVAAAPGIATDVHHAHTNRADPSQDTRAQTSDALLRALPIIQMIAKQTI